MKAKTRKSAAKRFKITKNGKGKIMRDKASRNHLLVNKSKSAKKAGRSTLSKGFRAIARKLLPNR